MNDDERDREQYASPPCFAHELDASWREFAAVDADTRRDVMRWRRAERERLFRLRASLSGAQRERAARRIASALSELVARQKPSVLSAYWPIRGEPDLRPWMREMHEAGYRVALPVVTGRDQPLKFACWRPGEPMIRGDWGIAVPARSEWLEPELMIAPLLGVDRDGYRLGNGGGYFDRTLAAAETRPLAVGVGYENARIPTIYPLPHDIAMGMIVTGECA